MLLTTWKSQHVRTLGDALNFDSIHLGGGTEHKDGTNCTALKTHMEGNTMDTKRSRKNKSGY